MVVHEDFEHAEFRQAPERKDVLALRGGELLCIGQYDLLGAACRDREHPRRKLVAARLLEQGWILASVQEILVGTSSLLQGDDLAFLPTITDLHRKPGERSSRRKRDAERAFERPIKWILEVHRELGEREGAFEHRVGAQGRQAQPGPVRCREGQRRVLGLVEPLGRFRTDREWCFPIVGRGGDQGGCWRCRDSQRQGARGRLAGANGERQEERSPGGGTIHSSHGF